MIGVDVAELEEGDRPTRPDVALGLLLDELPLLLVPLVASGRLDFIGGGIAMINSE